MLVLTLPHSKLSYFSELPEQYGVTALTNRSILIRIKYILEMSVPGPIKLKAVLGPRLVVYHLHGW